jgi:hypothetical protein
VAETVREVENDTKGYQTNEDETRQEHKDNRGGYHGQNTAHVDVSSAHGLAKRPHLNRGVGVAK